MVMTSLRHSNSIQYRVYVSRSKKTVLIDWNFKLQISEFIHRLAGDNWFTLLCNLCNPSATKITYCSLLNFNKSIQYTSSVKNGRLDDRFSETATWSECDYFNCGILRRWETHRPRTVIFFLGWWLVSFRKDLRSTLYHGHLISLNGRKVNLCGWSSCCVWSYWRR